MSALRSPSSSRGPEGLRNFTVRFLESALRRIESTAKPFYGGRLSTGAIIRRLAAERLDEIESGEGAEASREALLRLLSDWRSARIPSIADLRFLAFGVAEAYRRCTAEFVNRDLLIENVSALRAAVKECARGASEGTSLAGQYSFSGREASPIDPKRLLDSVEHWIGKLPALVTPVQAQQAAQNLCTFLQAERWPDDARFGRALRLYVSSLLQVSVRGYWRQTHRPLIGPETEASRERPRELTAVRRGSIALTASVRDHELWLAIELSDSTSLLANDWVEIEDLRQVVRDALERGDGLGETFSCSRELGEPGRFRLATGGCRWVLESTDVVSIAGALDALLREPSISNLLERVRFVYGRI